MKKKPNLTAQSVNVHANVRAKILRKLKPEVHLENAITKLGLSYQCKDGLTTLDSIVMKISQFNKAEKLCS